MSINLTALASAKANLAAWQAKLDNYDGNNPNKYRSDVQHARAEVARLTQECKDAGLIELTDQEKLWKELDELYPDTKTRVIVAHAGLFFQKRFTPSGRSNSGATVLGWVSRWDELEAGSALVKEFLQPSPPVYVLDAQHEYCKAWPFPVPSGGLTLSLREGAPAVDVSSRKTAVGYEKGRPILRAQLVVELTATREAMEQLLAGGGTILKFDYLGKTAGGKEAYLRKKGAGHKGLYVLEC